MLSSVLFSNLSQISLSSFCKESLVLVLFRECSDWFRLVQIRSDSFFSGSVQIGAARTGSPLPNEAKPEKSLKEPSTHLARKPKSEQPTSTTWAVLLQPYLVRGGSKHAEELMTS